MKILCAFCLKPITEKECMVRRGKLLFRLKGKLIGSKFVKVYAHVECWRKGKPLSKWFKENIEFYERFWHLEER